MEPREVGRWEFGKRPEWRPELGVGRDKRREETPTRRACDRTIASRATLNRMEIFVTKRSLLVAYQHNSISLISVAWACFETSSRPASHEVQTRRSIHTTLFSRVLLILQEANLASLSTIRMPMLSWKRIKEPESVESSAEASSSRQSYDVYAPPGSGPYLPKMDILHGLRVPGELMELEESRYQLLDWKGIVVLPRRT